MQGADATPVFLGSGLGSSWERDLVEEVGCSERGKVVAQNG